MTERRVARNGDQMLRGVAVVSDHNGPFRMAMLPDGAVRVVVLDTGIWQVEAEAEVKPDPLDEAVTAAVAARAAMREMEWRERQEREIRWQSDVLPLELAAERAEDDAIRQLKHEVARRAQEIETARLATVPEAREEAGALLHRGYETRED